MDGRVFHTIAGNWILRSTLNMPLKARHQILTKSPALGPVRTTPFVRGPKGSSSNSDRSGSDFPLLPRLWSFSLLPVMESITIERIDKVRPGFVCSVGPSHRRFRH